MIDGVSPVVRGRAVFWGRPRTSRGGRGRRALAAAHLLACGQGTHQPRSGHRSHGQVLDRGERGITQAHQGVAHPPGELAGDRQGGPVAALAGLDLLVVGIVGRAGTGGGLGGLKQRPAQHLWALAGQVAGAALAIGGVHGDVQAGGADHLVAAAEPAGIAQLGQDGRGR